MTHGPDRKVQAPGLLRAVAGDLRWHLSCDKGWLNGLLTNVILVVAYFVFRNYDYQGLTELTVIDIATGVAMYSMCGVYNTNQLGPDHERVRASLARGERLWRILLVKNLALGVIVVPITLVGSALVPVLLGQWRQIPQCLMFDLWVVFTWLAFGCVLSVLLPYCPTPVKQRWRQRRNRTRWVLCITAPFVFLLVDAGLSALEVWGARTVVSNIDRHLRLYALLATLWGLVLWAVALAGADAYARPPARRLQADLARAY